MKTYSHYSFDLWMTLIKSNPVFKSLRASHFFTHYNPLKKEIGEVAAIFRHVDLMCNAVNEKTGGNIDAEEMYGMVVYQLSGSADLLRATDINLLYAEMEQLVMENLPVIYNPETLPVLSRLKEDPLNTLSLLSNTAFIKGSTLRKVLKYIGLENYFDFQIYSDEAGISKPNLQIYALMMNQVAALNNREAIEPGQVIHIGDNAIADIAAAHAFGIESFQINSNDKLINDLFS